jgi:glycyl-tRNA synthetase beta chain
MNPKTKQLNALLEIGTEEIPARFVADMLIDLEKKAGVALDEERIKFGALKTLGTPRRLILYIEDIAPRQEDVTLEIKGPPKSAAYNPDGTPKPQLEGFAKSKGLAVDDLKVKNFDGADYVCASVFKAGLSTEDVLKELFPKLITSLYLPISMRWGSGDFSFVRPIHWIAAILGKKLIPFELAGIKSSNKVRAHRLLKNNKWVTIPLLKEINLEEYEKLLLKENVIIDPLKRAQIIKDGIREKAKEVKGQVIVEDDLLSEVTHLTEFPQFLAGGFNENFLSIPSAVLITSMKKNQKYFAMQDAAGRLMPYFVAVTNGHPASAEKNIREGCERVLSARLSDAKFFFEEDIKTHLEAKLEDLKKVTFHEKLGSVYDRSLRIQDLSAALARALLLKSEQIENIKRIAFLSKADLVTHMVGEFSSLQGMMGKEYALHHGESEMVAQGIYEHYLPRYAGDSLPTTTEGAIVSLADKFDLIISCFSIGLIPTGSADPYALRRAAQGIVSIVLDKDMDLDLDGIFAKAGALLMKGSGVESIDAKKLKNSVMDFIGLRLRNVMLEEGIRYDLADAALGSFHSIADAYKKAKALDIVKDMGWFKGVVMTADRVRRLAVNATRDSVATAEFTDEEEGKLAYIYTKVREKVQHELDRKDFLAALRRLQELTTPVDDYFVKVMVMHEDPKLRSNRLAMLKVLEHLYLKVADLSKVVLPASPAGGPAAVTQPQ